MKLSCKLFGHKPININTRNFTAECAKCGSILRVSYDMMYGNTIVCYVLREGKK